MAGIWYRRGTVSLTNGSAVVDGAGVTWNDPAGGVQVGNIFFGPDGEAYEVAYVLSATQLQLASNYKGPTAAAQPYAIVTPIVGSIPALSTKVAAVLAFVEGQYDSLDAWAHGGEDETVTITSPISGETVTVPTLAKMGKDTSAVGDALPAAIRAEAASATAITKASEASTSAATATTKASEASTSAATATTKASEASTSAATATTKASEASTSAASAKTDADRAEQAAQDAVGAATGEEIPFPDVWIPLNDSLAMLSGYGDEIKVGSYVVARMASFSRASGGTYIDKSGVLRTAAVNEPRFEKEGLLIEGQSTNLVKTSTVTASVSNGTKVVDGDWTSYDVTDTSKQSYTGFTTDSIFQPGTSEIYTLSLFAKKRGDSSNFQLQLGGSIVNASALFDINTGSLISKSSQVIATSSVELAGGVFRFSITVPVVNNQATASNCVVMQLVLPGNDAHWIMGGQIEALPFATSYIPTNGAAATRAADFASIPETGNDCVEWYSGGTPITPTKADGRIWFSGLEHYRNTRGFMTALTAAQKASIR